MCGNVLQVIAKHTAATAPTNAMEQRVDQSHTGAKYALPNRATKVKHSKVRK